MKSKAIDIEYGEKCVASIAGIDLTKPLSENQSSILNDCFLAHHIICERDQSLSLPQLVAVEISLESPKCNCLVTIALMIPLKYLSFLIIIKLVASNRMFVQRTGILMTAILQSLQKRQSSALKRYQLLAGAHNS